MKTAVGNDGASRFINPYYLCNNYSIKAFYQSSLLSLQSREVQWFVAYERPVSALIVYVSVGSCDQREIPMNQLF